MWYLRVHLKRESKATPLSECLFGGYTWFFLILLPKGGAGKERQLGSLELLHLLTWLCWDLFSRKLHVLVGSDRQFTVLYGLRLAHRLP